MHQAKISGNVLAYKKKINNASCHRSKISQKNNKQVFGITNAPEWLLQIWKLDLRKVVLRLR